MVNLPTGVKHKEVAVSGMRMRRSDYLWCYLFILPFVIMFGALSLWPLVRTVHFSLYEYNGIGPLTKFVGWANYFTVLKDAAFTNAYINSLLFTFLQTPGKLALSFLLAVILTRTWLKWRTFFRIIFFVPLLIPPAIIAMVFQFLLNPANGAINKFLLDFHLVAKPIDFFLTGARGLTTIGFISVWQITGQYMIYWMAALQSIPEEIYEAAEMDGTNEWQKIRYITLPIIKPIAIVIACLGLVGALNIFDWVSILTAGGPGTQSYVVPYYIYQKAFARSVVHYGLGSAAAFLFGLTVLVIVGTTGRLMNNAQKQWKEYTE
jgi:ABC-type sugar transport system permease subunit